jgi:hypothetical protein
MRKQKQVCLTGGKNNSEGTHHTYPGTLHSRLSLEVRHEFLKDLRSHFLEKTGVYILENTPPPPRGGYQPISFGGNYIKRGREKEGKCKRKGRKG